MRQHRVLVVDDSTLIRSAIRDVVESIDDFEVIGEAASGLEALRRARELAPDIISLDVEMPGIDGIGVLRRVMRETPTKVILVSSVTKHGADITLEGLSLGAVDFVPKAAIGEPFEDFAERLRSTLKGVRHAQLPTQAKTVGPAPSVPELHKPDLVAVASSTGGPEALDRFLSSFGPQPSVPMVIVQHMPPTFTDRLARRLDRIGSFSVREASDGDCLERGVALVAPGGSHMIIDGSVVRLDDSEPVGGLKPRADLTFRSLAASATGSNLAVVLTGMGSDGLAGATEIFEAGGQVLTQDAASVAVDGMPARVRAAGLSLADGPPEQLGSWIAATLPRNRLAGTGC